MDNETHYDILVSAVQKLSTARSLAEVTAITRVASRALAHSDGATFVLKDGGHCHYVDEDAISPLWKGQKFPLEMCISGWAMLHKDSVVIEDIYQDERVPQDAYRPTFVKSLLMVPIRKENPIGAIGNYWSHQHRATPQEMKHLQALADTVAVTIENIQLYGELQSKIQELDRANVAKDEFLSTLSHELRTPLNSICGWSQVLLGDELDKAAQGQALRTIDRNAKALTNIIEDLLDTSRIITKRLHLDLKPIDLHHAIESAIASVQLNAVQKGITIHWDQAATAGGSPVGDGERLQQVLLNLLSNALKFTPAGGVIQISLRREGPNARIDVKDTGEGLDPKFLPNMFELFRQADGSSTRRHGGLGLGLAISRRLIEAQGGRLEAFSDGVGHGSTFSVFLPLESIERTDKPSAAVLSFPREEEKVEPALPLAGLRILAVDDDGEVRELVKMILQKYGATIKTVDGAEEAYSALESFNPHLLISDLSMPGQDGFQLIRRIKSEGKPVSEMPAIALSAFADAGNQKKALDAGFNRFVSKPFNASRFVDLINGLARPAARTV